MNPINGIVTGFAFGVGLLLAALVMRLLFQVGWCG